MPRNVRNFWIDAEIDGRGSRVVAGPVRKDGGFSLRVYVRNGGRVSPGLRVEGIAHEDGRLELVTFLDDQATKDSGGGYVLQTAR